jgi:hypothetical protein
MHQKSKSIKVLGNGKHLVHIGETELYLERIQFFKNAFVLQIPLSTITEIGYHEKDAAFKSASKFTIAVLISSILRHFVSFNSSNRIGGSHLEINYRIKNELAKVFFETSLTERDLVILQKHIS